MQTLERVHPLGCHHVCAAAEGAVAASVGFAGEVKVWKYAPEDGGGDAGGNGTWSEQGEIIVGAALLLFMLPPPSMKQAFHGK